MTTSEHNMGTGRSNSTFVLICVGIVVAMGGLAYASVPLYDLFCRVTGYGGTTSASTALPEMASDRTMTVRFDASLNRGMPWSFSPELTKQTVKVGEPTLAFYKAHNPTNRSIVGTATYNVTPFEAGPYFVKVDCFCFQEQVLGPGEHANMPVSYYVDPAIEEDPRLKDLRTITLSYTFFEANIQASKNQPTKSKSAELDFALAQ